MSSDRALGRLLDYYQFTAVLAGGRLSRLTPVGHGQAAMAEVPADAPDLSDGMQALAWARAERANLLACLDQVTAGGQHARVVALTGGLAALLRSDGPWTEAITRQEAALRAARQLGDLAATGGILIQLADLHQLTGDPQGAERMLEEALGIFHNHGDRLGEANALASLGVVNYLAGDFPRRGGDTAEGARQLPRHR
jgi:tetratricopeptide (TPR) repeat protein